MAEKEITTVETQETTRTFTQKEVNAIVGERIGKIKAKYSDYDELKEKASKYDEALAEIQTHKDLVTDLQKQVSDMTTANELRIMRETVAKETKVPVNLLTGATKEDCEAQANAILEFAKPSAYPEVKDAGESTKGAMSATDEFAAWFNQAMTK